MTILACRCAYSDIVPAATRMPLLEALRLTTGGDVHVVDDLCALAARRDGFLREMSRQQDLMIVACYPRAVRWLFARGGAPLGDGVTICNMRVESLEEIAARLGIVPVPVGRVEGATPRVPPDGWAPWYPVIDYDCCRQCGACASFCLFGVYDRDEERRVRVASPRNCKNHCPACARVCPHGAIVFPKAPESPINGDGVPDDWRGVSPAEARRPARRSLYERLVERNRARLLKPREDEDAVPSPQSDEEPA